MNTRANTEVITSNTDSRLPNAADIILLLHERLAALSPEAIRISDKSAAHRGHAGALSGGHFHIEIVSAKFAKLSPLLRHRLVYETVGDLPTIGIHALSLKTKTPTENSANNGAANSVHNGKADGETNSGH